MPKNWDDDDFEPPMEMEEQQPEDENNEEHKVQEENEFKITWEEQKVVLPDLNQDFLNDLWNDVVNRVQVMYPHINPDTTVQLAENIYNSKLSELKNQQEVAVKSPDINKTVYKVIGKTPTYFIGGMNNDGLYGEKVELKTDKAVSLTKDKNIFKKKDFDMLPICIKKTGEYGLEIKKDKEKSYIVIRNEEGGLVGKTISTKEVSYNENALITFCKALIKSSDKSGELGYKTAKKKLVGTQMRIEELVKGYESKKLGKTIDCITVNVDGRNLKFLLTDIDIVFPSVKGISFPKNRDLAVGVQVICKNIKHTKFSKNQQMEVVAVNKPKMLMTVKDNKGQEYMTHIKRFKVI